MSISQAITYTYQGGGSLSLALTDALTLGIMGGLSYESAITQLQSTSIILPASSCGHFTFLPQFHTSWSPISTTQAARTADGKGVAAPQSIYKYFISEFVDCFGDRTATRPFA
ncbi:MAG: hypothetical protein Q9175_000213 [Cornicularia normoerica]